MQVKPASAQSRATGVTQAKTPEAKPSIPKRGKLAHLSSLEDHAERTKRPTLRAPHFGRKPPPNTLLAGRFQRRDFSAHTVGAQRAMVSKGAKVIPEKLAAKLRAVDSYYAKAAEKGFSGTVLIGKGDRVLFSKGYGLADRKTERPNAPGTQFDLASVSKPFVGAAILKLQEQGKLQLDDPISKYFDVPAQRSDVTLRHLLQHRSGLGYPDDDVLDNNWNEARPREGFSKALKDAPRIAAPGEKMEYNNIWYSALANVVEQASGVPYETYLQRELFRPAGMKDTGFKGSPNQAAVGYNGKKDYDAAGAYDPGWLSKGATGIISTAQDMFRWSQALRSDRVLSAESKRMMFDAPRVKGNEEPYALGWTVRRDRSGRPAIASHSGNSYGFETNLAIDLKNNTTVVVLSNDEAGGRFVGAAEGILFD